MCGRYTLIKTQGQIEEEFDVKLTNFDWLASYNIAPTQEVLTVTNDGERRAELMRWGLVPHWAKDAQIGSRMINAKSETLATKPSFRVAYRKRRCLVLADGFFEWEKEGKSKIPMYICLKSRELFAFAGLWESWTAPSGDIIRSCTIITTEPNHLIEPIHNRMPVILPDEAAALWLDPATEDPNIFAPLLRPFPADSMDAYEVSSVVNSPKNYGPECVEPVRP